jgi:hypothetical protein
MNIVEHYMNSPRITYKDLTDYLEINLKGIVKDLIVVTYLPSFNDGDECNTSIVSVIPLFHEHDCTTERASEILRNEPLKRFRDFIEDNENVLPLFDDAEESDNYEWKSLSGKQLWVGRSYLYWPGPYDGPDFTKNHNNDSMEDDD